MRLVPVVVCAALSMALVAIPHAAAQEFSSVEERMSQSEFEAAGLDKLDAAELEALNAWLRRQGTAPGAPAPAQDMRGLHTARADGPVETRVAGRFTGWRGKGSRITLTNGQVWETIEEGRFAVNLDSPEVTITPAFMGSWMLSVRGYNASVRVRRIQ